MKRIDLCLSLHSSVVLLCLLFFIMASSCSERLDETGIIVANDSSNIVGELSKSTVLTGVIECIFVGPDERLLQDGTALIRWGSSDYVKQLPIQDGKIRMDVLGGKFALTAATSGYWSHAEVFQVQELLELGKVPTIRVSIPAAQISLSFHGLLESSIQATASIDALYYVWEEEEMDLSRGMALASGYLPNTFDVDSQQFAITGLPAGTYHVNVSSQVFPEFKYSQSLESLAPGEEKVLDIDAEPGGFLSGSVVDSFGTPVAGAEVWAIPVQANGIKDYGARMTVAERFGQPLDKTDKDGKYLLGPLAVGTYQILVDSNFFYPFFSRNVVEASPQEFLAISPISLRSRKF